MVRRSKHEGQLERWARLTLRGSLLAGAILVMLVVSGGPQKVAAEDGAGNANIREALSHCTMDGVLVPRRVVKANDGAEGNSAEARIREALLKTATAPAACPMCGKPTGACCCGGSDKCSCGK